LSEYTTFMKYRYFLAIVLPADIFDALVHNFDELFLCLILAS
jgi:hypothetical protein